MGIPTGWELILLLAVLVLLFGATKLPTAARSIGQSLRIFKAETKGMRADDEESPQQPQQQSAQPPQQAAPSQAPPSQALPPSAPQAGTPISEPQRRSENPR